MPLNLSFTHIMVVLVVALIVLGPDKLPDAARSASKMIAELRRMSSGLQAEVRDTFGDFAEPFTDLVNTMTGGVIAATSAPAATPPPSAETPVPAVSAMVPTLTARPSGAPVLPALPTLNGSEPAVGTFAPGPPAAEPIFAPLGSARPEGFSPGPGGHQAEGPA